MAGPVPHRFGMAEFEKPGDQMRRDATGLRPDPIVKISSVHSDGGRAKVQLCGQLSPG
ncbi:hypothetical protein [Streptomyces mirabilis]|uniref:hypothetical protein n=1 Tax=Streptomyces mirabilis TaxID=68239 RepID=UPI0038213074